ncbi:MYB DNA-binding domain protein [Talaromyces stipitatus ATCC 10500]|uniref:MYB DNA-binding domain protein n=1 Tax=Talaromyces stipitatus (strain ATCC 10500 / CBS 375.48 / QM 6759 / NRRL 1006) TaxID=441959 RepID=B8MMJ3_TALSN|nr:MYB DNA-binding domain protein [Talaromyces stipitatus ATCC 10500]EED13747.1 MYB DNA-binding domain protein [Talaromyces stipitatus ATCC 10500]
MSSFVNPLLKYPDTATPRTTRSAATPTQTPNMTKDSRKAATATPVAAKSVKLQQTTTTTTPRRSQVPGGRRSTRSQSREADEAIAQNGNGKGKGKKAQPDLAPVGEEADAEHEEDVESSAVSSSAARQQLNSELEHEAIPDSPNGHDVSGATLLPGDSDADGDEIDAIAMAESLPNLQAASTRLLDFFSSSFSSPSRIAELARHLANPKSSQSRKLQYLSTNFSSQLEFFGSDVYIPLDRMATIFPPIEHESKSWRVDGIIYKSNCAQLALEILTRITMTEDVEESLYALEGQFPLPFLKTLASDNLVNDAGKSGLRRQTFDLALQVRTQFLKMRLLIEKDQKGLDPNLLLHDVFYNENLDTQASADTVSSLRGFPLPAFQDSVGNLPEQYVQDVQDQLREITGCFNADGQVDFDALEERFPWEEFIFTVAKWLRSRNEELNRHLDQQPRVEDILDKIENSFNQAGDAVLDTQLNESESAFQGQQASQQQRRELLPAAEIMEKREISGAKSFGNDLGSLVALARVKERLSTGNVAISGRQNVPEPGARFSRVTKATARRSLPVTPQPGQPAGRTAGHHGRVNRRLQSSAQAFIDHQTTASRVSPIDSQRLGGGASSSRKRAREDDIDEDEDGEFESDDRRIDLDDRRAQKPVQNAKRARYDNQREDSTGLSPPVRRAAPSATAASGSQSSPPKPAQIRRNWTVQEDEEFIRLVEEHGTSWSKIKSQDELGNRVLLSRKQVDLKDRARNLVMIKLKGGLPYNELPKNFDQVPLKKADVENLRKRGIHIPDRQPPRQINFS